MHFTKIQMIGFQTWQGSNNALHLSSGLNVMSGKNEIGKSVLSKVISYMICPAYTPYSVKDLISRGSTSGTLLMFCEDGTIVAYRQGLSNKRDFYLYNSNRKIIQSWCDILDSEYMPEFLINHLGIIVGKNTGFLYNIRLQRGKFFLVDTTSKENAQILNEVTSDPRMTDIINHLDEHILRAKQVTATHKENAKQWFDRFDSIPYVDTTALKIRIEELDAVADFDEVFTAYRQAENIYYNSVSAKPIEVSAISPLVSVAIELVDSLISLQNSYDKLSSLIEPLYIQPINSQLDLLLECLIQLSSLKVSLTTIDSLVIPTEVLPLDLSIVDLINLTINISSLNVIVDRRPDPPEVIPVYNFNFIYAILDKLITINNCQKSLFTSLDDCINSNIVLSGLNKEIDLIEDKLQVCPLCGSMLGGKK